MLVFRIMIFESYKMLFALFQEVEFVLENHSGVIQSVLYYEVACLNLLVCERYLREVILTFVRVVLCTVQSVVYRVLQCFGRHYRVALLGR